MDIPPPSSSRPGELPAYAHGPRLSASGAEFRLWARGKTEVTLVIDGAGEHPMSPCGGGWFSVRLTGIRPGTRYGFRVDRGPRLADPASRLQDGGPEGWSVVVPHAATWPYELLIAPQAHLPDLASLDDDARDGLAAALVEGLGRLDLLFDRPMPYMAWVHQRPTDGRDWPLAHVRVEVAPLWRADGVPRFVAAGELGSGLYFNPVLPEEAAEALRRCSG